MLTLNGHDYSHYDIRYYGVTGKFLGTKAFYTRPSMATSSTEHLKADAKHISQNLAPFHYTDKDGNHADYATYGVAIFASLSVMFKIMEEV